MVKVKKKKKVLKVLAFIEENGEKEKIFTYNVKNNVEEFFEKLTKVFCKEQKFYNEDCEINECKYFGKCPFVKCVYEDGGGIGI